MCGIHVCVRRHRSRGGRDRSPAAATVVTTSRVGVDGDDKDDYGACSNRTAAASDNDDIDGAGALPPPSTVPDWLRRRGPDHCASVAVQCPDCQRCLDSPVVIEKVEEDGSTSNNGDCIHRVVANLHASVLQMRESLIPQPLELDFVAPDGSSSTRTPSCAFLAWNGEVYQVRNEQGGLDDVWDHQTSDTELVAHIVREAWSDGESNAEEVLHSHQDSRSDSSPLWLPCLAHAMGRLVNAEYAFCVAKWPFVVYGRDVWGRRSLLTCDAGPDWHLSSVIGSGASGGDGRGRWEEVVPGRLHCYSLLHGTTVSYDIRLTTPLIESPVLKCSDMVGASCRLEYLLLEAVRRRLPQNQPTSILFSGGVDSVVLAAMALEILNPVTPLYLINVEFVQDLTDDSMAADTTAARASHDDLIRAYPHHTVTFLREVVPWREVAAHQEHVRSLVAPKATVMDLNIGAALWFASRAAPTRVVLTGLGADEQMGGYGRHRKAWERGKLREELNLDLARLWERNLGRDDRVLSDHGKEARFPFLDCGVVEFLKCQELDHICDFTLPPGVGDKRILRLVAERLGCKSASAAVKRAIQFGSRIAHVSDRQRFGSRRKASGDKMLPKG